MNSAFKMFLCSGRSLLPHCSHPSRALTAPQSTPPQQSQSPPGRKHLMTSSFGGSLGKHWGRQLPSQPHVSSQACPWASIGSPTCLDAVHHSPPPSCGPRCSVRPPRGWLLFCVLQRLLGPSHTSVTCFCVSRTSSAISFTGAAPFLSSLAVCGVS